MKKINKILAYLFLFISGGLLIKLLIGYLLEQPVKVYDDVYTTLFSLGWSLIGLILSYAFYKSKKWLPFLYSFVFVLWLFFVLTKVVNDSKDYLNQLLENFEFSIIFVVFPFVIECYLIFSLFVRRNSLRKNDSSDT